MFYFLHRIFAFLAIHLLTHYSSRCGPCKALIPRLESTVNNYSDKVLLAKVDIDSLGDIATEYEVINLILKLSYLNSNHYYLITTNKLAGKSRPNCHRHETRCGNLSVQRASRTGNN